MNAMTRLADWLRRLLFPVVTA